MEAWLPAGGHRTRQRAAHAAGDLGAVEFQFIPHQNDTTYLRITETGFTGTPDTQISCAVESTSGFTFLLSSLKAAHEHDITLRVTMDAHPPNLQTPSH